MSNQKAINSEVLAISILTMEASQKGTAVCSCDYAGHTQELSVRIYPAGSSWTSNEPMPEEIYSDSVYLDRAESLDSIRYVRVKVTQAIDSLREGKRERSA